MLKTFGKFEFDDRRRRLSAGGQPVKLSGQAIELLGLLLERPGDLITREEIEHRLWPDRNVDFHHSLDVIVSRLRTVLGDKGSGSRYIETVAKKGYRFIEPVMTANPESGSANRHWRRQVATYAAVAILAAIVAILVVRARYERFVPPDRSQPSAAVQAR